MEFYRVEHHTIMSGHVVRFRLVGERSGFEINASRDGVMVQGASPHMNAMDAGDLDRVIQRALELSNALKTMHQRGSERLPSWFVFDKDPRCVVELHKAHFAGEDEIVVQRPNWRPVEQP